VQHKTAPQKVLYGYMAVSKLAMAVVGVAKTKEITIGKSKQHTFQVQ
jgi:hypothetical protein